MSVTAQELYTSTCQFIIEQIKKSPQNMLEFIQTKNLNERESFLFKQLVVTDGAYKEQPRTKGADTLLRKRVTCQKDRQTKIANKNKDNQYPSVSINPFDFHWKLRSLSCIINGTNNPVSTSRRYIAKMLTDHAKCDEIKTSTLHQIVLRLGNIKHKMDTLDKDEETLRKNTLNTMDIKQHIQSKVGTSEITHEIDHLCALFIGWDELVNSMQTSNLNLSKLINRSIIDLGFGSLEDGKMKYHETQTTLIEFECASLLDLLRSHKKALKANRMAGDEMNKQIILKRANTLYQKKMKRKRGDGIQWTEEERAMRYTKRNGTKYDKKLKKQGKKRKAKSKNKKSTTPIAKKGTLLSMWGNKKQLNELNTKSNVTEPMRKRRKLDPEINNKRQRSQKEELSDEDEDTDTNNANPNHKNNASIQMFGRNGMWSDSSDNDDDIVM
eukprot:271460_1